MSTPGYTKRPFQIGDRVRIIGARRYRDHVGKETVVTGFRADVNGSTLVEVDLPPTNPEAVRNERRYAGYLPKFLQLIYDGHEPCAWDESLFNPFKESASV